jgi:hypothetical protein
MDRPVARRLLVYTLMALVCGAMIPLHSRAMYPGLGKLPLSPVPYERPTPEYPSHLEIKPVRPSTPVIPGVIFRPPSEVLRNFGELRAEPSALESPPNAESDMAAPRNSGGSETSGVSRNDSRAPQLSPAMTPQHPADPLTRPTRRQALGW